MFPTLWQAVLMAVLLYTTLGLAGSLILLVVLFNDRQRAVHDFFSGEVVVPQPGRLFVVAAPRPHLI